MGEIKFYDIRKGDMIGIEFKSGRRVRGTALSMTKSVSHSTDWYFTVKDSNGKNHRIDSGDIDKPARAFKFN